MVAPMVEACGNSRNRASQVVDPDCADAEVIKPAHAAIVTNTHQRRRIGSSCLAILPRTAFRPPAFAHAAARQPPADNSPVLV